MKVGKDCDINPGLIVDYSHCWLIEIKDNVTIAPHVYLLAHDASTKKTLNYTKIGHITIDDFAFIGARSIIMPNVTVGKNSIVAAGSVVTKSVDAGTVVGGNPARFITTTEDLIKRNHIALQDVIKYDETWTIHGGITKKQKEQMRNDLKEQFGYVV